MDPNGSMARCLGNGVWRNRTAKRNELYELDDPIVTENPTWFARDEPYPHETVKERTDAR